MKPGNPSNKCCHVGFGVGFSICVCLAEEILHNDWLLLDPTRLQQKHTTHTHIALSACLEVTLPQEPGLEGRGVAQSQLLVRGDGAASAERQPVPKILLLIDREPCLFFGRGGGVKPPWFLAAFKEKPNEN